MQGASAPTPHPGSLPPGTVVGSWRVVSWAGRGVYGAVYHAVPVEHGHAAPVALKLALRSGDPRFAREVELLSRVRHPSIPRWMGSGSWPHPDGTSYPYVAMEWVEGVSLYDWAQQGVRTPEQMLGVLAHLAGALAELHARGGVHRDVKGDNVLVRDSDGRAMLIDFGMGSHEGTATLTPPGVYPGTPLYRAPEASAFELRFFRERSMRYSASPADDIYALGVTACRLVTGEYPQFADPWKDEHGIWQLGAVILPPALGHTEPRLRECIQRMLSLRPEERGTAAQLAEVLEQAAKPDAPKSPSPLPAEALATPQTPTRSVASRERPAARKNSGAWLPVAAMVLALTTWMGWLVSAEPVKPSGAARVAAMEARQRDAGTAGLGEAAATTSMAKPSSALPQGAMAEDTLPEPMPGQAVPDAKGRCPRMRQVPLNGGCWGLVSKEPEVCADLGGQMYQGSCYVPIIEPQHSRPRPRASSPTRRSIPR